MNIQSIRQKYEQKVGKRDQVAADLKATIAAREAIEIEIGYTEKSQAIISAVAQATQNELQYRITEPVSLALASVYDNPYKMVARFEITGKGTTECHLGFERNGNVIVPVDNHGGASGGGPIDVASFALRIGAWSLAHPRSRACSILDEPAKWLQRDKVTLFGQMATEMSRELLMQFIMISHIPELIEQADRIFWIDKKENESTVKFFGDINSFINFLSGEKEKLKEKGKRASTYQRYLYDYFLR